MENQTDKDLDQQAQDADDNYQDIVVEDAASMPDGCLGDGDHVCGRNCCQLLFEFLILYS